jgi:hypothetical protein
VTPWWRDPMVGLGCEASSPLCVTHPPRSPLARQSAPVELILEPTRSFGGFMKPTAADIAIVIGKIEAGDWPDPSLVVVRPL